ncbi:MAG: hypothetical protein V7643_3302 [Mycobacterium sp.]
MTDSASWGNRRERVKPRVQSSRPALRSIRVLSRSKSASTPRRYAMGDPEYSDLWERTAPLFHCSPSAGIDTPADFVRRSGALHVNYLRISSITLWAMLDT